MDAFTIRPIEPADDPVLARIIRDTLTEFNAATPGTVYFDPSTDALYRLFCRPKAIYYVAGRDNCVAGGAGIYPTDGLPPDTCELVKMYLLPAARGKGLGRRLIEKCLAFARETGYKKVYLETMPELKQALKIYAAFGFDYLKGPLGNSGHTGCSLWMLKTI